VAGTASAAGFALGGGLRLPMAAMQAAWRVQVYGRPRVCAMDDRWVTSLIDRYFLCAPTADSLRAIMLLAATVQAVSFVAGLVALWHAIECGLSQHHGHSIVCTVGVVIAIASFEIAAETRKRAHRLLEMKTD
jgi:hypothetical protein